MTETPSTMPDHTADDSSTDGPHHTQAASDPTRRSATLEDIRGVYADQAERFARLDALNRLFTGRYRRRLFERAEGRVLDVACGTGLNARYLPESTEYVGIDISPEMLAQARERLDGTGREHALQEMDAQALDFPDDSFDTVVSSLSTCTFPDPQAALAEMNRVCAPDGRVLLLEHGRSDVGLVGRLQDWRAETHFENHACRLTQEPLAVVGDSPLRIEESTSALLGVVTAIEARPG